MSKNSQLNIIKITKKDYQKKAREKCQSLSKEEKEKKQQYGCEQYKISLKMKNESWLSIEKNITKCEKAHNYN